MLHKGQRSAFGLRAAAGLRLVGSDDGMVRFEESPGVVIATDKPIREYVPGVGYARVALKMSTAMLARWLESGALDPNGHLLMGVAHNPRYSANPASSSLGRWENLRVDARDGYKALVADPAFDPAAMAALMRRIGADPDDWRGMVERGTIQRTSIWWSGTVNRAKNDDAEPPLYVADPWEGREASWVALGADPHSGANRSTHEDTMDPEQIEALLVSAARRGAEEALAASQPPSPAPEVTPDPSAPRVLDEDPTWKQLQATARDVLGAGALDAANAARGKGTLAESIASLTAMIADALRKRTAGNGEPPKPEPAPVPVRHRIEDGDVNAYRALTDLVTICVGRGMRDVPRAKTEEQRTTPGTLYYAREQAVEAARAVRRDFETYDPRVAFVEFARATGLVEPGWYSYNPREILETIASEWRPSGQEHIATMGGRWFSGRDPVMVNGRLNVLETLRHGAAGSLVPADLQAVYLAVVTKVFLQVHDAQIHQLERWGRSVALSDLNKQTLIRHDMALGFDAVVSNQPLPEAFLFDDAVDIATVPRGVVWTYGWEAMFTDGAQILAGTPAIMAMNWMSCRVAHWFKKLFAGIYTSKGAAPIDVFATYADQNQTEADLGAWFNSVLIASGDKPVVPRPNPMPAGVKPNKPTLGTMEPDLLLYGNRANQAVTNHFAARQQSRVNGVSQDAQLSDFEQVLRDNKTRSPFIDDDSLFAIITSGPAAAMTSVGLAGQGMQITSASDVNIRELPSNVLRIIDTYEAELTHPHGVYKNKLS